MHSERCCIDIGLSQIYLVTTIHLMEYCNCFLQTPSTGYQAKRLSSPSTKIVASVNCLFVSYDNRIKFFWSSVAVLSKILSMGASYERSVQQVILWLA